MKKQQWLICLIISIIISVCTGCGDNHKDNSSGMDIYYIANEKLVTEKYQNNNDRGEQLVEELLGRLTKPGELKGNNSAIPEEVSVQGYSIVDGIAKIDFDEKYYELSPKKELFCRAAVVLTLIKIKDVEYVAFTVNNEPCKGKDGRLLNAMDEADFVSDIGNKKEKPASDFVLYFANEDGTALKEYKLYNVSYGDRTKEQFILNQLIKGPEKPGYTFTISPKVKVLSIVTANNICYVDFDENFLTEQSQVSGKIVIYSIVNALSELDEVHKVQISVKGETSIKYKNEISLEHPFIRNLDIIEEAESLEIEEAENIEIK